MFLLKNLPDNMYVDTGSLLVYTTDRNYSEHILSFGPTGELSIYSKDQIQIDFYKSKKKGLYFAVMKYEVKIDRLFLPDKKETKIKWVLFETKYQAFRWAVKQGVPESEHKVFDVELTNA